MNKLLKVLFIIVIIAILGAAVLQLFVPNYLGTKTNYGINYGWQREIGFWNIAVVPIIVGVLIKKDYFFTKIMVISLIIGGIGFGTNHLIAFINNRTMYMSLFGAIENYLFAVLWCIGLYIESKNQNKESV